MPLKYPRYKNNASAAHPAFPMPEWAQNNDNRSQWESDHLPCQFDLKLSENRTVKVVSYNVHGFTQFSGYGKPNLQTGSLEETSVQKEARSDRIVAFLQKMIKKEAEVILLQEVVTIPNEQNSLFEKLQASLDEAWEIQYDKHSQLISCCKKEKIKWTNQNGDSVLDVDQRIRYLQFYDNEVRENFDIYHIYGIYNSNPIHMRETIRKTLRSNNGNNSKNSKRFIIGDTNSRHVNSKNTTPANITTNLVVVEFSHIYGAEHSGKQLSDMADAGYACGENGVIFPLEIIRLDPQTAEPLDQFDIPLVHQEDLIYFPAISDQSFNHDRVMGGLSMLDYEQVLNRESADNTRDEMMVCPVVNANNDQRIGIIFPENSKLLHTVNKILIDNKDADIKKYENDHSKDVAFFYNQETLIHVPKDKTYQLHSLMIQALYFQKNSANSRFPQQWKGLLEIIDLLEAKIKTLDNRKTSLNFKKREDQVKAAALAALVNNIKTYIHSIPLDKSHLITSKKLLEDTETMIHVWEHDYQTLEKSEANGLLGSDEEKRVKINRDRALNKEHDAVCGGNGDENRKMAISNRYALANYSRYSLFSSFGNTLLTDSEQTLKSIREIIYPDLKKNMREDIIHRLTGQINRYAELTAAWGTTSTAGRLSQKKQNEIQGINPKSEGLIRLRETIMALPLNTSAAKYHQCIRDWENNVVPSTVLHEDGTADAVEKTYGAIMHEKRRAQWREATSYGVIQTLKKELEVLVTRNDKSREHIMTNKVATR